MRSKGILAFTDDDDRYVFQGVHMMLEGDHQRKWKDGEPRESRARLHRPRIAGADDPRRFRELYHHVMKEFDPGEAPSIASITDQVRPLAVGMPVTSIHFLGDTAVFVGAEENAALVNAAGEVSTRRHPRRRHAVRGVRRQAYRHRRR